MLTLFESRYILKGRYNIGNVGKTASMSMLTLFESRYTLKWRYSIGNVGKTASMSMLTLFESRYTLKGRYNIGNVGKTASMGMLTLFESKYTLIGRYTIGNVGKTASMSMLTLFESRYLLHNQPVKVSVQCGVMRKVWKGVIFLQEMREDATISKCACFFLKWQQWGGGGGDWILRKEVASSRALLINSCHILNPASFFCYFCV